MSDKHLDRWQVLANMASQWNNEPRYQSIQIILDAFPAPENPLADKEGYAVNAFVSQVAQMFSDGGATEKLAMSRHLLSVIQSPGDLPMPILEMVAEARMQDPPLMRAALAAVDQWRNEKRADELTPFLRGKET